MRLQRKKERLEFQSVFIYGFLRKDPESRGETCLHLFQSVFIYGFLRKSTTRKPGTAST